MKEYDFHLLLDNKELLQYKLQEFLEQGILVRQNRDEEEAKGHIEKAENNLRFIKDNLNLGYYDWCITGCYYASYHAVALKKRTLKCLITSFLTIMISFFMWNQRTEEKTQRTPVRGFTIKKK